MAEIIRNPEAAVCQTMIFDGAECKGWAHPSNNLFEFYVNTGEVIEFINQGGKNYSVAIDGLFPANYSIFKENHTSYEEILDGAFVGRKNVLTLSDFISEYAYDRWRTKNKLYKIGGGVSATCFGLAAALKSKGSKKMTRMEFIKFAGLSIAGAGVAAFSLNGAAGLITKTKTDHVNNCDDGSVLNNALDETDDPNSADRAGRTGLSIVKQVGMINTGFYDGSGIEVAGNKDVWGTDHFRPETKRRIREVIDDPETYTTDLLKREAAHCVNQNMSTSEAIDTISTLHFNMGVAIPLNVLDIDGHLVFPPTNTEDYMYYEPRILGYDTKGMSFEEIIQREKNMALVMFLDAMEESLR